MRFKIILFLPILLLVVCIAVAIVGTLSFNEKVEAEVSALYGKGRSADTLAITERELTGLPSPIQRYLRHSGVVGKPRIQTVRLRQKGIFRSTPDQAWMPFEAEQYYTVNPPGFVWFAHVQMFPLVTIDVRDMYAGGKGNMIGKMMSTITVVEGGDSPELNQGAMLRYLGEIVWFPTAWLSDYLSWEPIDSYSAKVTMRDGGMSASGILHVNESGQYVNFEAERFMGTGGVYSLERWSAPMERYGEFNGIRIPTKGPAVWNLKSGDFPYIRVEIESVEYNTTSPH